jgi:hypothetical protein
MSGSFIFLASPQTPPYPHELTPNPPLCFAKRGLFFSLSPNPSPDVGGALYLIIRNFPPSLMGEGGQGDEADTRRCQDLLSFWPLPKSLLIHMNSPQTPSLFRKEGAFFSLSPNPSPDVGGALYLIISNFPTSLMGSGGQGDEADTRRCQDLLSFWHLPKLLPPEGVKLLKQDLVFITIYYIFCPNQKK